MNEPKAFHNWGLVLQVRGCRFGTMEEEAMAMGIGRQWVESSCGHVVVNTAHLYSLLPVCESEVCQSGILEENLDAWIPLIHLVCHLGTRNLEC